MRGTSAVLPHTLKGFHCEGPGKADSAETLCCTLQADSNPTALWILVGALHWEKSCSPCFLGPGGAAPPLGHLKNVLSQISAFKHCPLAQKSHMLGTVLELPGRFLSSAMLKVALYICYYKSNPTETHLHLNHVPLVDLGTAF